jgi:hypothetical protein
MDSTAHSAPARGSQDRDPCRQVQLRLRRRLRSDRCVADRRGVVALIADVSERLTSEQRASRAVDLAIRTGAPEFAIESFAAGTTYLAVVRDTFKRMRPDRPIRVTSWSPKGSGRGRVTPRLAAPGLRQALDVGSCRVAVHLPDFETQAVAWQSGSTSPIRSPLQRSASTGSTSRGLSCGVSRHRPPADNGCAKAGATRLLVG